MTVKFEEYEEVWSVPVGWTAKWQAPPAHCRACGLEVLWAITPDGKRIPLDHSGARHITTCPLAKDWVPA